MKQPKKLTKEVKRYDKFTLNVPDTWYNNLKKT